METNKNGYRRVSVQQWCWPHKW